MTVREMSNAIENYCCGDCSKCRLLNFVTRGDVTTNCYSYDPMDAESEDVIVENYKFLFGEPASESTPDPEAEVSASDVVNRPSHYCQEGSMECIDEMVAVFGREAVMNFCLLNVWKYRKRAVFKNGEEDLKKSDWYMKKYIELKGDL